MVLKIGHRGASGYEPENTFRSFRKALEFKVDMIELDVHCCKTGEVVVIHDDKVDRTTDGKGTVREKTLEALNSLDAGKGEKIPLLQEVLDLTQGKAKVNIELKGEGTAKPVVELVKHSFRQESRPVEDFLISSFRFQDLFEVKALEPKLRIGVITDKLSEEFHKSVESLSPYSVHPSLRCLTLEFVQKAHEKGLKVFVWTANSVQEIRRMKSWQVDGIFSDYPDRL